MRHILVSGEEVKQTAADLQEHLDPNKYNVEYQAQPTHLSEEEKMPDCVVVSLHDDTGQEMLACAKDLRIPQITIVGDFEERNRRMIVRDFDSFQSPAEVPILAARINTACNAAEARQRQRQAREADSRQRSSRVMAPSAN